MFTLYKKRGFSEYISDTITFFTTFGKHYFKNYFIINGGFLLVLMVLVYFIFNVYFEILFSNIGIQNTNPNYLIDYFNNNTVVFVGSLLLFFILVLILSILNVAYPVLYLQLVEKRNGSDFTTAEIVTSLKNNFGRMLKFLFGILFTIMPLLTIVFILSFLLVFILIGIPLLLIIGPACISWITLSFHDYLLKETGFFESLRNGFQLVKQQFWPIVGTTIIMAIIIQVIQGIITMIPYALGLVFVFTTSSSSGWQSASNENMSTMGILFTAIMVLSVLQNYFFNNFLVINQGLIYFSLKDANENTSSKFQIDLIGTDNE